jgi:photosystem II stability/assembly factor-like uncharacterized protein
MSFEFERLSPADQKTHLRKTRAAADWAAATGPLGGVIGHLRNRAVATRRTAKLFLAMLVLSVVTGLVFYLGLPFWQTWADGREEALNETLASISARKVELDAERKALLGGGRLLDGSDAPLLTALLEDSFISIPTDTNANLLGSFVHGGRLYFFGDFGTLLRLAADGKTVENIPTDTGAYLLSAVSEAETTYLVGGDPLNQTGGTVLRLADDGTGVEQVPTSAIRLLNDVIAFAGQVYAFGWEGPLLRLNADGSGVETVEIGSESGMFAAAEHDGRMYLISSDRNMLRLTLDGTAVDILPSGSDQRLLGMVSHGDRLYLIGDAGKLLRLTTDGNGFETIPTGVAQAIYNTLRLDDRLYIVGDGGTLLRLAKDGSGVERIETGTEVSLFSGTTYNDRLYITGDAGTLLRLSEDGTATRSLPTGSTKSLMGATVHDGQLIVFGDEGTLLTELGATVVNAAKALPSGPDPASLSEVDAFFEGLPGHIRDWEAIRALRNHLSQVASERSGLDLIEERTKEELGRLQANPLQYLRERSALDFGTFLTSCRGGDSTAEITTACLAAWSADQAQAQRSWWEALTDQLPPGILLLFLLATLGGLYRYNVRLAGFHESRADFLTLIAHGRTDKELRDTLASTPGDAVNLATMVLAADNVEMGAIKAKLGQAEIELAKALKTGE